MNEEQMQRKVERKEGENRRKRKGNFFSNHLNFIFLKLKGIYKVPDSDNLLLFDNPQSQRPEEGADDDTLLIFIWKFVSRKR